MGTANFRFAAADASAHTPATNARLEIIDLQTSIFHGLRESRCKYFSASFCTVLVWSSHSTRSLFRYAMLASRHVADERKHFSISLFGRWRVFTHSRKFVQCSGCGSETRFISLASRSAPFSGVSLYRLRSTYSVPE